MVYARTGDERYRQEVLDAVMAVMGTEGGDDIAEALERLNEDPALRRQMGTAGREKVEREFNLHISAAKRAELYVNGGTIQEGVAINLVPNS